MQRVKASSCLGKGPAPMQRAKASSLPAPVEAKSMWTSMDATSRDNR